MFFYFVKLCNIILCILLIKFNFMNICLLLVILNYIKKKVWIFNVNFS